ncbi:MAG: ATP-binding protein [Pseudomonadota bacterium]
MPPLLCDADKLQQALANILGNSLKYSDGEIALSATVEESGRQIVICVADRGVGMTPEQLPESVNASIAPTLAAQPPAAGWACRS